MRSPVDWEALARRLEAGAAALAALDRDDRAMRERVLEERAVALAVPARHRGESRDALQVLAFQCGGERYAFETAWVARVLPLPPLTAIPGLPGYFAGVTMSAGEVLAVLDLRALLALPLTELAEPSALIVLRSHVNCFAVLADAIDGTCGFAREHIGHRLPMLANLDQGYLLGVSPDRTALLDAQRLLADSTLVVNADH